MRTSFSEENYNYIVRSFKKQNVVILPTDTLYAISCDATNPTSIKRLLGIKGRDKQKSFPLLFSDYKMINSYTDFSEKEMEISLKYWPGPLTIISKKKDKTLLPCDFFEDTIGVRIPNNNFLRSVIHKLGRPIIGTSANFAGKAELTDIYSIEDAFSNLVDDIFEGDAELSKLASTIIKVQDDNIVVLRDGVVKF